MEDYRAITDEIEHVEKSFQVVTYSTICTEHIQHNNDDVIIVEVSMTRQKFQKLLNPEINQTEVFGNIKEFQIFLPN